MLTNVDDLPTGTIEEKAIILGYCIKGIVAIDQETGAEMRCSHAHRKYGRPTRYYVSAPDGGIYIHYFRSGVTPDNPRGRSEHKSYGRVFGVTAFTDAEAVEKANTLFTRKYAKFMAEVYHEHVREEGRDFGTAWWQREED